MDSTSILDRYQNQGYTNFLKIIEGLLFVRDGVGAFCTEILSGFQAELLKRHNIQKECTNNKCKAENIKNGKLKDECPYICSLMLKDILAEHGAKKTPNAINWTNSQIRKWPSNVWEIAKVYMGRGQKHHNGPHESDSAAIFQLLKNCIQFKKFVSSKALDDLSGWRNRMMHRASLSVDHEESTEALNFMIRFLKDLIPSLSAKISKEPAEEAVEKLTELMSTDFETLLKHDKKSAEEREIRILREIISNHESRLTSIEGIDDKLKEVEEVIPLLQLLHNSPDLMEKLDVVFDNLHTLSQLDERVTAFEAKQESTENRVSDVEQDVMEMQRQLNSLAVVDKAKPLVTNYKGKLKNFLDAAAFLGTPKYKAWPDAGSNNNWMANVTLILKSETKTFECSASCKRVVDAEHSAASEALQFLNKHPEVLNVNDVSGASGEMPVTKLEELLRSYGFKKAAYSEYTEKFNGTVKSFTVSVSVCVNGIFQKKINDDSMKPTDMERAAAKEAVGVFCEDEGEDNAKALLYRWCGKKNSKPCYFKFPSSIPTRYIHIVSSAFTENCNIEMESEWCNSKKEAKQNAADLLLKLFNETGLSNIWSDRDQTKAKSHLAEAGISGQPVGSAHDERNENLLKFGISEKKAMENVKGNWPDPDYFDDSPSHTKLEDLCKQLHLESPEFHIISDKSQYQIEVSMWYIFGNATVFKNKAEAESEAAKAALDVLLPLTGSLEQNKPTKSLLNELFQKKKLLNQPEYLTEGSAESFYSKVKINFAVPFDEKFQTELEAKEFSAKKILQALGYRKNHFKALEEKCVNLKVKSYKSNAQEHFCAVLDMTYVFAPTALYQSKKEAEKNAACYALKIVYPHIDNSDLDKCKNNLQEQTPKVRVIYTCIPAENGKFMAKVEVSFEYEGDSWHREKDDAMDEVAEKFLKMLFIQ